MRKTILAAAAIAAVLSIGATANKAAAAPTQLGLATSDDTSLVQKAAIVCGYYGCRHVWWGWHPRYSGWHPHYWGGRRW